MIRGLGLAVSALLLAVSGCQTVKSRSACQQDVERLKVSIAETDSFLQAADFELRAGFEALASCDSIAEVCDAGAWLARAETLRRQHRDVQARFARAVEVYQPDACLAYSSEYRLNPPPPHTYNGFFTSLDHTGEDIARMITAFEGYARDARF